MKDNKARFWTILVIFLFVVSLLSEITFVQADSWPMYRGNLERTGSSASTVSSTSDIKWVYNFTEEVTSSPAVANGRLIIGISNGDVIALNSTTGAYLWNYEGDSGQNSIWSGPAINSGKVYIGNRKGSLLCIDETMGALLWSFPAGGEIDSSPAVKDGRVNFATTIRNSDGVSFNTEFYSINSTDGSLIWNYEVANQRWDFSSPAIVEDTFYGCTCTSLYALNAVNGALLWNISITQDSTPITSTPLIIEGKIYVNAGASISCINANSGSIIWTKTSASPTNETLGAFRSSPAISGNNLIVCSGLGTVFSLNAQTGAFNWKHKVTEREIWSSPAIADGKVVVGAGDGKLYCLNANDGSLIWSKYTFERIVSSPAVCDGTIYVGCGGFQQGRIYAFGAKYTALSSLTLSLNSQTAFLGFKVKLTGTLTSADGPISNVPITLSFSVNGGEVWNDITAVPTGADGSYEAVWVPSATGTYLVKASWKGGYPLSSAEQTRSLSVTLYDDQYVFSVVSNSTVSALLFDSVNQELSFTVIGEPETTGFVDVMIAKTLVPNIVNLKVYMDQTNLNYKTASENDSWLLHFTYGHSTHGITLSFNGSHDSSAAPTQPSFFSTSNGFSPESLLVICMLSAVVTILTIFITAKMLKGKRKANI
jgi:outer membrane protein assembly factor BamB